MGCASLHPPYSSAYASNTLGEIACFFRKSGKVIVALTVREVLDEEIARKLG